MTDRQWYNKFKSTLKSREAKLTPKLKAILDEKYKKALKGYNHSKRADSIANDILNEGELAEYYDKIYQDIYVGMGKWSTQYETKAFSDVLDKLKQSAKVLASLMFNKRGEHVLNTQRKLVTDAINTFRSNPQFLEMNERESQRILRAYFKELSSYQARRIIRTEATNAANAGVIETAKQLFPERKLYKKWLSTNDDRTRSAHKTYKGKFVQNGTDAIVPLNSEFYVGGEVMPHPGAGQKGSNNIFCRCVCVISRNKKWE